MKILLLILAAALSWFVASQLSPNGVLLGIFFLFGVLGGGVVALAILSRSAGESQVSPSSSYIHPPVIVLPPEQPRQLPAPKTKLIRLASFRFAGAEPAVGKDKEFLDEFEWSRGFNLDEMNSQGGQK